MTCSLGRDSGPAWAETSEALRNLDYLTSSASLAASASGHHVRRFRKPGAASASAHLSRVQNLNISFR
jgi:hypothetical protein